MVEFIMRRDDREPVFTREQADAEIAEWLARPAVQALKKSKATYSGADVIAVMTAARWAWSPRHIALAERERREDAAFAASPEGIRDAMHADALAIYGEDEYVRRFAGPRQPLTKAMKTKTTTSKATNPKMRTSEASRPASPPRARAGRRSTPGNWRHK